MQQACTNIMQACLSQSLLLLLPVCESCIAAPASSDVNYRARPESKAIQSVCIMFLDCPLALGGKLVEISIAVQVLQ